MRNWFWIVVLMAISSCDISRVYETNLDLPNQQWVTGDVESFEFEIADVDQSYNVLVNVTNAQHYPFHNLYYQYELIGPDDGLVKKELVNINLFDPKTGEPFGEGLGDLFDHRQLILQDFEFPESGKYIMNLEHYMRRDTLPLIKSIGLRVEQYSVEK